MNIFYLSISLISVFAFAITLARHMFFKRELVKLKEDMKKHKLEHGVSDDRLWSMFDERTREMLRFMR